MKKVLVVFVCERVSAGILGCFRWLLGYFSWLLGCSRTFIYINSNSDSWSAEHMCESSRSWRSVCHVCVCWSETTSDWSFISHMSAHRSFTDECNRTDTWCDHIHSYMTLHLFSVSLEQNKSRNTSVFRNSNFNVSFHSFHLYHRHYFTHYLTCKKYSCIFIYYSKL